MILVFHLEKRIRDFYSGYSLDLDNIVKICRNFKIEKLVIINESEIEIKILDETFKWEEYLSLEDFEKKHKGEIFYLETPYQKKGISINEFKFKKRLAIVLGATRGLLGKKKIINIPQSGVDAFYPTDLIPIICYEYYKQLWQQ